MNIFVLHEDPAIAAQMQHDKHVIKMILETAQMLSAVARRRGFWSEKYYRASHENHPCTVWAGDSMGNANWLLEHGWALADEYTCRFGKKHASESILDQFFLDYINAEWPEAAATTEFAQAMPDEYRVPGDAVAAYRNYYLGEKIHQSRWTRRPVPAIFKESYEMAKKDKISGAQIDATTVSPAEAAISPSATADKLFIHNKKLAIVGDYKPESAITWNITRNPRAPGRGTFDRFAKYFGTGTVAEYTAAGGTKGDLLWDLRSGYLSIEGVTLGGELKARAPKVAKAPSEPKAPRVKKEKAAKVSATPSEDAEAVEAAVVEEMIE